MRKTSKFHCKNDRQKAAIRRYYAKKNKDKRVEAPYPHFRYYKKSRHPALIVGEQPVEEYRYRKVMHGDHDGERSNECVFLNPNPKDSRPMHIGKRVRHDKKSEFEDRPLPWKYPKK